MEESTSEGIKYYLQLGKLLHFKQQRMEKSCFMFSYSSLDVLVILEQKRLGQTKGPGSPIVCSQLWSVAGA